MKRLTFFFLLFIGLPSVVAGQQPVQLPAPQESDPPIHHSLKVLLDPIGRQITVEDTITFPEHLQSQAIRFELNSNLAISSVTGTLQQLSNNEPESNVGINATGGLAAATNDYSLSVPGTDYGQALLIYSGSIYDLAEQSSPEYAQSFSETSGIIGEQGVYLNYGSAWFPIFGDRLVTFDMEVQFVDTASTWKSVSQGDRFGENGWQSRDPMEEIYLIAANFTEYAAQAEDVEVLAYLRTPDSNLATRYMDATERYLKLYEPLLGDYPYSKFALVENFWETGYGMPSFTLLGEQVIRFPFILESSYPHEILHNWWGNGVYPDYESGNWSEGLTAYLADHLFREMDGAGAQYRKDMLSRYKNYVAEDADFPLTRFTSRNSAATQAVGYGKTLMLWHMLRIELGDELFVEGLRKFYSDYKYKRASYADIERLFTELSGLDLSLFFNQWVNRIGAPQLSLSVEEATGNRARIMFAQTQFGDPYSLKVPVALYYEGETEPQIFDIALSQKLEGFFAEDYGRLQAVLVDPYFDVFRQLDREETPPTIGELFGAGRISFVLPGSERQHWAQMAESFGQGVEFDILYADQLETIPTDRSVWILGRDNPFTDLVNTATELYGVTQSPTGVQIAGSEVEYQDRSTVLIGRHPADPELAIGWIHIEDMIAMPGMIEKLPHYGRYSYLSFIGSEPTNDLSGIWSSPNSPMQWKKADLLAEINWEALPAMPPLTTLPPKYLPEQLLRHATRLTSDELEGRELGSKGADMAALYIADQFRTAGLQPLDGTYIHRWRDAVPGFRNLELANVVGVIPGANRSVSAQPIVIGAHYDHLGINEAGELFTGADDNASGVSVLIEVATKVARAFTPQRPIIFVAFTGEEYGLLGSEYFVQNPPGGFVPEDLFAMINLDAVGRLDGRTLQVFGTESAYEWPFMAQGIGFTIGVRSEFPTETIASSDHVSFLNAGIPAIHLFSGTHLDYHQPTDTLSKLDTQGMSDIALWLEEAVIYLGSRIDPLRVNLEGVDQIEVAQQQGEREASLGTIPDFSYAGDGVRISGVTPNGAAEEAGLQPDDVLLSYNGETIVDMQNYSNLLRNSAPGDIIELMLERNGQQISIQVTLKSR
ncbi:MAG: M28 family peptidase [Gammaproteobacteria bacterium]|nr:M28 family peptidase [Gammaproteobacteria bacterium]MDD9894919.1 M28 family peptidase [Gammaproteobacteria bacterium]MDD9958825.1 M28 family peptidase [Gammaproteobacteria bacterium]